MYPISTYEKATTIQEAIQLLEANPRSRLIAGGTDVLIRLHKGKKGFDHLVDIHDLDEIKEIAIDPSGTITIGAGVSFSSIMNSEIVLKHIPILAQAVATIGGPQIRNMATIGGNLCNGVPSADSAPSLYALNAIMHMTGPSGERALPIDQFFLGPGKVALQQDEILTRIETVRASYDRFAGVYFKYAMRGAMDIATIGCAALCQCRQNQMEDLRLAFGVAGPTPLRCPTAETWAGKKSLTSELLNELATKALEDLNPRDSWRAAKDFREQIIATLTRRVVKEAASKAGGLWGA